ncbi:PDPFL protein, partial [Alopecoenas beccarii]|nr:PDPFL protein [Alopecoenas beccarii]
MASVPSAGCLLAKKQYYRSEFSGGRELPGGFLWRREAERPSIRTLPPSRCPDCYHSCKKLPELVDKYWWIKSFFHCEPSPPNVGRKTLSAS